MRISDWSSDVCSSDLGVATATVAALFGLPCTIFMGAVDVARQQPNVFRMKLLGAEVVAVEAGARTLKDAMNEALRHWVANVHDTFSIIGTVAGPHPYPELVRDFQSVIGRSEEHTSELQSLMRISYAVFFFKNKQSLPPLPSYYDLLPQ